MELHTIDDLLGALLAKNPDQPRDEPEIASSIGAQLLHMELPSMPVSLNRRIRDIVSRTSPQRVCEIGSGIGHLSSWLLDLWDRTEPPEHFHLVEEGGKFGVILTRLVRRYDAESWAHVTVGNFEELSAANSSWHAAHATIEESARTESPLLHTPFNLIIVNVGWDGLAKTIRIAMENLEPGGLILTAEPEVPVADVGEIPESGPETIEQSRVSEFNEWVSLINELNESHSIGFVPLFNGTLVGFIQS
ncbi:MAG: hypothetical protein QF440_07300 [Candidatus Thalassarchaeaceae archaeon]|nr:hypothetical protein [Candidatus Thalassarchaeaceae archaeon]